MAANCPFIRPSIPNLAFLEVLQVFHARLASCCSWKRHCSGSLSRFYGSLVFEAWSFCWRALLVSDVCMRENWVNLTSNPGSGTWEWIDGGISKVCMPQIFEAPTKWLREQHRNEQQTYIIMEWFLITMTSAKVRNLKETLITLPGGLVSQKYLSASG